MSHAQNYDDVLQMLQDHGLQVGQSLRVGTTRSVRCRVEGMDREKRGWYWLHEMPIDGDYYLVGSFGIFQGNDPGTMKVVPTKRCEECHHWVGAMRKVCPHCGSNKLKKEELTAEQKAAVRARIEENKRRQVAERKRDVARAAARAQRMWQRCRPTWTPEGGVEIGSNSYLLSKKVGAHGVRFTPTGALVIPMTDNSGSVHGLQFVLPKDTHADAIRKNEGKNKKFWPAGMAKQGMYHLVGSPATHGVVLVAEGYASGASPHEITGLPFATAFDAGNLQAVATALRKKYRTARILFLSDDDAFGKCPSCKKLTPQPAPTCAHCGEDTSRLRNAGIEAAELASIAIPNSAWIAPAFADPEARQAAAFERGEKLTDFNDLFVVDGPQPVRDQIEAKLLDLGWTVNAPARGPRPQGCGEKSAMPSSLSVEDAVARYWGTYGLGGKVLFDEDERRLVHRDDVMNLLPDRAWSLIKGHPLWRVARDTEIGFDPSEKDPAIRCNLFGGWPIEPKQGKCETLLELLEYLCQNEENAGDVYQWILRWLAYPLQHRGAKMQSAVVVHGPQGTGKSRFFEACAKMYGPYGRVLGQEALEDKFNADWAEKKLFIVGDEVLARQDMYHIKNRLKGFITGDTIRVNPKNLAAHNEKNQINIVFLSNERQPIVLESDDRRHCVIWAPPKPPDGFFAEVNEEIDNGGVEALYHYLLNLDLGDFKPWTKPPMTRSKSDLIELGRSSEERFINEWIAGEIDGPDGRPLPFCPCLGSHLYAVYAKWCETHGERKRGAKDLISLCGKKHGWQAGQAMPTWFALNNKNVKNRKMVVPNETTISDSVRTRSDQAKFLRDKYQTKAEWLTIGYFAFEMAMEAQ